MIIGHQLDQKAGYFYFQSMHSRVFDEKTQIYSLVSYYRKKFCFFWNSTLSKINDSAEK